VFKYVKKSSVISGTYMQTVKEGDVMNAGLRLWQWKKV